MSRWGPSVDGSLTTLGVVAGYLGCGADSVVMRVTDAVMSVPALLMVIVFVSVAGPSLQSVIIVIAIGGAVEIAPLFWVNGTVEKEPPNQLAIPPRKT